MKYMVTTRAIFSDVVEVEAESSADAELLAHERADYTYDQWYEATAVEIQEEEL